MWTDFGKQQKYFIKMKALLRVFILFSFQFSFTNTIACMNIPSFLHILPSFRSSFLSLSISCSLSLLFFSFILMYKEIQMWQTKKNYSQKNEREITTIDTLNRSKEQSHFHVFEYHYNMNVVLKPAAFLNEILITVITFTRVWNNSYLQQNIVQIKMFLNNIYFLGNKYTLYNTI